MTEEEIFIEDEDIKVLKRRGFIRTEGNFQKIPIKVIYIKNSGDD